MQDYILKLTYQTISTREELNNNVNTFINGSQEEKDGIINLYGPIENWTLGSNITDLLLLFNNSPFNEYIILIILK